MQWLKKRFALSDKGAIELIIASFACAFQNFALMLPVGVIYSFIIYMFVVYYAGDFASSRGLVYLAACFICALMILITTYFQYNSTYLATYRESGVRRINLAERLRKIPLSFFSHKDLADLTASIMNDCAALETSQSHFLAPLIGSIISTSFIALSLIAINFRMAISALWVLPVAFAIVTFSAKVRQKFSRRSMNARISCEEGVQEFLEASKDLWANNFTGKYISGLTEKIRLAEKSAMISELGTAVFVVSAYLVLRLGIVTTVLTGSLLYAQGDLSMPIFILFILTVSRLYDPLEVSLQNLAAIIATRSGIDRMNEIYSQPLQTGSEKLTNRGHDIKFENVCFNYDSENEILHDLSFTAKQGEVTALAGPSGSGKTTAVRLILRFWDVSKGAITIGGMNISKIDPEKLMSLCSVVFQDVILFNNSIIENIRIGRKNASNRECIEAGKLANCEEFVSKLPDGWNTVIGENGCELSGGERQRISIARAFLKNAPIILLDEATASLDAENESAVQNAISKLIQNKTVLIIAHRMRTIMKADKIIVIKDGKISEQGKPEELLQRGGLFADMAKAQGVI